MPAGLGVVEGKAGQAVTGERRGRECRSGDSQSESSLHKRTRILGRGMEKGNPPKSTSSLPIAQKTFVFEKRMTNMGSESGKRNEVIFVEIVNQIVRAQLAGVPHT